MSLTVLSLFCFGNLIVILMNVLSFRHNVGCEANSKADVQKITNQTVKREEDDKEGLKSVSGVSLTSSVPPETDLKNISKFASESQMSVPGRRITRPTNSSNQNKMFQVIERAV